MGPRARLTPALLLALAACRGAGAPGAAVPPWAADLPGNTALVAWRSDGARAAALDGLLASPVLVGLRRIDVGPVVAAVTDPAPTTGWKSLAESTDFREALDKLAGASECYFESGLWLAPAFERLAEKAPAFLRRRLADVLRLESVRYLWLARDPETGTLRGALETTGTDVGLPALLGVARPAGVALPALARERAALLRATLEPKGVRRFLEALLAGDGSGASPLDLALPIGLVQPFLAELDSLTGSVAVALESRDDFVIAAELADPASVLRLCEERFRRRGELWLAPANLAVAVEVTQRRLIVFGPNAPERTSYVAGSQEPAVAPSRPVSWHMQARAGSPLTGEVLLDRTRKDATALSVEVRR